MKKKILRKKLWKIVLFLIIFNALALPMYAVIILNTNQEIISYQPLQFFLRDIIYQTLKHIGYTVSLSEDPRCSIPAILISDHSIDPICISWDCTGWKTMYALLALTIATPLSNLRVKFKFLAVGIPTLFFLNYLRIITTILISLIYGVQYFKVVHTLLWREGLILAVIAIWYLWLKKVKYNIGQK
jgi:exosortase/archaeosortase family protein